MKKTALLLMLLIAFTFTACSSKPSPSQAEKIPDFNCDEAYGELLENFYEIVINPEAKTELDEGETGVCMVASNLGENAPNTIGYVFKDLNNDGKEELLIGAFEKEAFAATKNEIYAAYTYDDKPVLLFESMGRESYALTENNTFCYYGSSGALYYYFGEYELIPAGTLKCIDYYFSQEKDEDYIETAFFHNTTGEHDISVSDELDVTQEEFFAFYNDIANTTTSLNGTKFSEFVG